MDNGSRIRARNLGINFTGNAGKFNSITDVPGIEVGYVTRIEGSEIRTGVTAILPRGKKGVGEPCAAAVHSFNGNGELTGSHWIEESGSLATPILITNTHAVGPVHQGTIEWMLEKFPDLGAQWLLPVVAETWDGYLNAINKIVITPEDAKAAIEASKTGPIEEGSVGGGTGMNCYGYKAGSGTSSRIVQYGEKTFTVGVFLQTNFGSPDELVIRGVPIPNEDSSNNTSLEGKEKQNESPPGAGSVIAIVATDAPLLPGQCKAMARRISLGLARTGTSGSHFSGDIFLAFSTANAGALTSRFNLKGAPPNQFESISFIPWGEMDIFYRATVEAVEEAVINSLVAGRDMQGRNGNMSYGLSIDRVKEKLGLK